MRTDTMWAWAVPFAVAALAGCGDDTGGGAFGGGGNGGGTTAATTTATASTTAVTTSTTQGAGGGGGAGDGGGGSSDGGGGSTSAQGGGSADGGGGSTSAQGGAGGGAPAAACDDGCTPSANPAADCDDDGDLNETDCQPCDALVFHGQTDFFSVPFDGFDGAGLSFDYDCSASEDFEYELQSDGCTAYSAAQCPEEPIYTGGDAPICGASHLVQDCAVTGLVLGECTADGATSSMVVRCR